ncbi:phage-like protein [Salmonella bongori]|nr:phage-like protein [Salmonella bongori]
MKRGAPPLPKRRFGRGKKLSQEAKREAGGWRAWAQAQGISILNASTYLTNTGLTVIGMERLQPLKERGSPITEAQLLAWFSMSPGGTPHVRRVGHHGRKRRGYPTEAPKSI